MLQVIILGVCLLAGLALLSRWFVNAEPKNLVKGLRYGAIALAVLLIVILAIAGRLGSALGMMVVLIPVIMRWRALANRFKAAAGPQPGQSSDLSTGWLKVTLDHDTGAMDGTIRRGRFEGRTLGSLSLDEVRALYVECSHQDPESASVVEAYLQRTYGQDWHSSGGDQQQSPPSSGGSMTREEAYEILGLEPDADETAIREAYHRLMKKVHPDQGGSDYFAAKVNQAKDLLLER